MKKKFISQAAIMAPPRYKNIVWLNIFAQIAFPLATVFTPAMAAKSDRADYSLITADKPIETQVYILKAGENPETIAIQYNISLGELQQLNAKRSLPREFHKLKTGDTLDIPLTRKPFSQKSQNDFDTETAALASSAGNFFNNNPNSDAAINLASGMATNKANAEVQQWLNQFGTARVQLGVDKNFSLKNSQMDLLLPIWEQESNLLFTQGSVHRTDERNQINLGFGLRHFEQTYMIGGNTFFDHDLSRSHSRIGLGLEYWRDYSKLAANAYLRQSNWKNSTDFDNYEERPANGWDLRAEAYLPSYPHLGGKLTYEQYYGDEVGLFGKDSLQKDPYAISTGVNYTPFPLLTVSAENRQGKSGENDTRLGLTFTYELGSSLSKQLDPAAVAARRSLIGSRYDLIERNNNIVLEYRKKEQISLYTVAAVSGHAGKKVSLDVSVTARNGLSRIDWNDSAILLNGGKIVHDGGEQYSVILPEYKSGSNAINTYNISAVAYDNNGNASSPSNTVVTVSNAAINQHSVKPEQFVLVADGQSVQTITLTLRDKDGLPITGLANEIHLNIQNQSPARAAITTRISDFKEISDGEYSADVTAGTKIETLVFTPVVQGITLTSLTGYIGMAPIVSELKLSGKLESGQTLNGSYVFDANNSDTNDHSLFAWGYKGETADRVADGETVANSGTVNPYLLSVADAGKVVELSVQAKNSLDVTGNTLTTDTSMGGNDLESGYGNGNGQIINPAAQPVISQLVLSGKMAVGQALSGRYSFDGNNGDITDKSTYVWGDKGATAANVAAGQTVTASGEVAARTLVAADAGKTIELSVQAKNGLNVSGNTLTTDTAMSGNQLEGGDGNGQVINPQAEPVVSQLVLSGKMAVGQALSGSYSFDANAGDITDKSTYVWGYQGATAASVSTGTVVTTSGKVATRTLIAADAGKVIELSVQAKNSLNVSGNTLTTDTSMSGNQLEGGDSGAIVNPAATPVISTLVLSGKMAVGQALSGSYSFNANNGDITDKSTYSWGYKGTTAASVGSGTAVTTSGEVATRTLVAADAGKVIELSVQAKNGLNVTGNTLTTDTAMSGNQLEGGDSGAIVNPTATPVISQLVLSGKMAVGEALSGSYSFDANTGDITDKSTYVWGNKGTTAASVGSGTAVTTSGKVASRTLAAADAGKVIELSVQAKNGLNVTGNTLTTDTATSGNQLEGGDSGAIVNPAATPVISQLVLSGKMAVGQALSGSYVFNANTGDITDKSTYAWGYQGATAANVASGSAIATSGEIATRTLVAADAGKVIELSVQAKNGLNVTGNTLTTDTAMSGNQLEGGDGNGQIVNPAATPVISALVLSGKMAVGEALSGSYSFDANTGDNIDKSTYVWGNKGTTAANVASGTAIATSGEVASRTLVAADAGKVIELSVQAKNGLNVTGNTLTTDTAASGNQLEGGDNGAIVNPTGTPLVSALVLSGKMAVGEALSGSYVFDANTGDITDKSTYVWGEKGTTAASVGSGAAIATSGEVATRTLVAADAGKVIELSVQAKNGLNVTGNTLTTDTAASGNQLEGGDSGAIVNPAATPVISQLVLNGKMAVGEALSGSYSFDANTGDITDKSTYVWGNKGTTAASVGSGTAIATSGEVASRTLVAADAGKVIELSVQAKNGLNVTGNTLTTDTAASGNQLEGGDNGAIVNPESTPLISALVLSGKMAVGEALSGSYVFDANTGDNTDKSTYVWGEKGTTAANVTSGTAIATSGEVAIRTLVAADAGKVIELSVQAKNGLNVTGNTLTTDTAMSGNQLEGGDSGAIVNPAATPVISTLVLSGKMAVGEALSGSYSFDANTGDITDKSTYVWGEKGATAANVAAGAAVTTSGEVATRTLVAADAGKVIELSVQAKNGLNVTGNTLTTDTAMSGNQLEGGDGNGQIVNPAATPVISQLVLSGKMAVGEALSGSYSFDANTGDNTDKSTYVWGEKGATAANVATGESITTSGSVKTRALVASDAGKVIELSVQAKNGLNVTGNTLTTDTAASGNQLEGGDSGAIVNPAGTPLVSALVLSGKMAVGEALSGSYVFDANTGDNTDKSTYVWGNKDTTAASVGSGTAVTTSGEVATRTLVAADAGKVIELSVQAKNGLNVTGNTLTTDTAASGNQLEGGDSGAIVNPESTPLISALVLSGKMAVGEALSGSYVFDANTGDNTDKSTYVWGEKGTTAANITSGTAIATSGEVATRTLVAADAGKVIELSVQAKNGLNVTGNTLTTDTAMSGNELEGGDSGAIVNPAATPSVSALVLSGKMAVGEALSGSYVFDANTGDNTDKSTYVWGEKGTTAANIATGETITTSGEVATRTLVAADAGKVIELSVQAKNGLNVTGNTLTTDTAMSGNELEGGDSGAIVNPAATPLVSALVLSGKMAVGEALSGSYVFDANTGDNTDKSTYVWGEKGATAADVATGETITTSGEVATRTLVAADAGKVIELSVRAKNGLNVTGNTLTTDTAMSGNELEGGDSGAIVNPAATPVISTLALSGKMAVGEALSGSYSFDANTGDNTDKSTYVWGEKGTTAANVASGTAIATSGEVATRTLVAADAGKVIELSVQAKNGLNVTGNTLTTDTAMSGNQLEGGDNGAIVNPTATPVISALALSGKMAVGEALSGSYSFDANTGDITDKSTYVWGEKDTTAANVAAGTEIATSGEVATRTLVAADAGKVIELSVQAKNGLNVTGNTLTTDTAMSGNQLEGGDNGAIVNPEATPLVSALVLSGKMAVGEALNGSYVFNANTGDNTDKSTYEWGEKGATAANVATGETITTSGSVKARTLALADAGKVIELSVQAKNGLNVSGNTLTTDTAMSGNELEGGDNGAIVNPAATPLVSALALSGKMAVGEALSGSYVFDANTGDNTDKSTYVWGEKGATAANVATGETITTSGEVATRTLVAADAGKVIELSVQAKNGLNVTGNTLTTDTAMSGNELEGGDGNGQIINPAAEPVISQLVLSGKMAVGEALSGSYSFDANTGDITDKSTYVWGEKGATAANVATGETITTSGEVAARTLVAADAGKVIELSVQAKNGLNVTGNTLTTDTAMSGNQLEGGDGNGQIINPQAEPEINQLVLSGKMAVGEALSGSYSFDANTGDITDKSTYVWGEKGTTAASVGSGTAVTTSGEVATRTLALADAGKVIELSVQAKNGLNVTGNTLTTDTAMSGNELEGGNGGTIVNPAATPLVSALVLSGKMAAGEALSGSYSFDANTGDMTDKSTYAWGYKGTTAASVGSGTTITTSGEVAKRTLVLADAGKVIELSVQAKNGKDLLGNTLTTDTTMEGNDLNGGGINGEIINPQAAPSISQLVLSGVLNVGERLNGNYAFDANGGDITDKSTYVWGDKDMTAASVGSGAAVTTPGEVARTLVTADAGKVIELSVQAKNSLNVTGNTLTTDTSMSGNNLTGGNGGLVMDPTALPTISNLKILGDLAVGGVLTGTYSFNHNFGDTTDNSVYLWGYQGDTKNGVVTSDQAIVTSGKVPAKTLTLADAGKTMELSVEPINGLNLHGNVQTAVAASVVDATIVLSVGSEYTAEVGKTANVVVEAKYQGSDAPVTDVAVKFVTTKITDRKGTTRADSGQLQLDGAVVTSYSGKTGSDGKLTVAVTDPNGIGVKTDLSVRPTDSAIAQVSTSVIFTVITSPDTAQANMWGHMPDTITAGGLTFTRPTVAYEVAGVSGYSFTESNETWRTVTHATIAKLCSKQPTKDELQALYLAYPGGNIKSTFGWPTAVEYRSSTTVSGTQRSMVSMKTGAASTLHNDVERLSVCLQ